MQEQERLLDRIKQSDMDDDGTNEESPMPSSHNMASSAFENVCELMDETRILWPNYMMSTKYLD